VRRPVLLLLVLAAVWLAAASVLFLVRRDDPLPAHAAAVVVLAGDASHRLPTGVRLVDRGVAPILVVSRESGKRWSGRRLCDEPTRLHVICVRAHPYSTRGEAAAIAALARRRGWRSVVVVTSGYHVVRARLLFRRCLGATRVAFRSAGYDRRWIPLDLVLESVKLLRAETVARGC
jgi:uncharacterized SAM-binding protein YcdF (DUF218 family)